LATRATDTPIIDQDHRAVLRQAVGVDRIEIVHRAGEMLKAHHRRGAFLAEMPVGEAHTADILELGRRGFAEIDVRHGSSPGMLIASPSHAHIRSSKTIGSSPASVLE